jgi:alpha,alpha-trehalase
MFKNEVIITEFCKRKKNFECAKTFKEKSERRQAAMNSLMWSDKKKCWGDLNLKTNQVSTVFYISHLAPLWHGASPPAHVKTSEIVGKHAKFFERYQGGVPYSEVSSGQQWDYPNMWAPYHQMLVNFLDTFDRRMALKISRKFFNSVHEGWLKTGMIYEKYDASMPGVRGTGGEYEVQAGFGWTNGVTLYFINHFMDELVEEIFF